MTALQAIQQARETGQIALTKPTANILEALAAFDKATEDLTTAIDENLPVEISDPKASDTIMNEFYNLYSPLQEYIYKTIGDIVFRGVFVFQFRNEFKGL